MKLTGADAAIITFGLSVLKRATVLLEQLEALRLKLRAGEGDPEEASHLMTDICANAGMASTCLFDDGLRPSSRERARQRDRRQARARYLMNLCAGASIEALTDRTVRNRLMHADEYLSRMGSRPIIHSSVIEDRSMLRASDPAWPLLFDRVLVLSENTMLHLDQELGLGPLRSGCKQAYAAINDARGDWGQQHGE